jgi:hypothetical protein
MPSHREESRREHRRSLRIRLAADLQPLDCDYVISRITAQPWARQILRFGYSIGRGGAMKTGWATVRQASVGVTLAGLACAGHAPPAAEPSAPHVKLILEPPAAIALQYTAVDGARHTVTVDSVVEAGGRVDSIRGDTITIVASYITKAPAAAGAKTRRTPVREPCNIARLTIVVGPAVRVEPLTVSPSRSARVLWYALMVVTVAPLLVLIVDVAHSPR